MSDFDARFMETTSFWASPSSPSPRTILAMLNQTDNDLNPIHEIFPQANLPRDHDVWSEQRSGLGQRLASRIGFNPPTLDIENVNPFAALFRNLIVPSPVTLISPGFSPSGLLQSPMFSNSSQVIPPHLNTNYRPPAMVESFDEGNDVALIFNNTRPHQPLNVDLPPQEGLCDTPMEESVYIPSHEPQIEPFDAPLVSSSEPNVVSNVNNDVTHQLLNVNLSPLKGFYEIPTEDSVNISSHESHIEPLGAPLVASFESDAIEKVNNDLPHQPMNIDLPPQEGVSEIPTEKSFYIPSHESHFEPFGAPLVASFESDAVGEVNIISIEGESKSEEEEEEDEDHKIVAVEELDVGSSSSKRRKFEGSNMIGATRINKTQRVILQMECEEDNPDDGFRWRKYGRKVVKGNHNPRSYYKCTSIGCNVKKHVERGADDDRILVITYDGIHEHSAPPLRSRDIPRSRNRTDSPMSQNQNQNQNQINQTGPQTDMKKLYLNGLSMLPSLPINHQNLGFIYRNEEPMIDVIPDGTRVYNGIMDQLYANFGMRF